MYPGVDPTVHVYAPLGPDLLAHLGRVSAFNRRAENPTSWRLEVHTGPDSMERMLREKPGNVVVLSGRNRGKMDRILASVEGGLNVLADKPWLIAAADFPKPVCRNSSAGMLAFLSCRISSPVSRPAALMSK